MIPIHKTTHVPLSPAEAFDLFMANLDTWWPKDRHASDPTAKLIVEPRKNGRIIEICTDGTQIHWGTIIGWDPDRYMAFTWHPDGDEDAATVVAVSALTLPHMVVVERLWRSGVNVPSRRDPGLESLRTRR